MTELMPYLASGVKLISQGASNPDAKTINQQHLDRV